MKIVNISMEKILRNFNEVFRKDVTYNNIKSYKNPGLHPPLENTFWAKPNWSLKPKFYYAWLFLRFSVSVFCTYCLHIYKYVKSTYTYQIVISYRFAYIWLISLLLHMNND